MQLAVLDDMTWLPAPSRLTVERCSRLPGVPVTGVNVVAIAQRRVLLVDVITRGWSLPGGRTEPGELPLQTASRELLEEAGLLAEGTLRIIGTWRVELLASPPTAHPYPAVSQIAIAGLDLAGPPPVAQPRMTEEIAGCDWVDRAEIAEHHEARLLLPLVDWALQQFGRNHPDDCLR